MSPIRRSQRKVDKKHGTALPRLRKPDCRQKMAQDKIDVAMADGRWRDDAVKARAMFAGRRQAIRDGERAERRAESAP